MLQTFEVVWGPHEHRMMQAPDGQGHIRHICFAIKRQRFRLFSRSRSLFGPRKPCSLLFIW